MALNFRLHREEDLAAMRAMWANDTDWGNDFAGIFDAYINNACLSGACVLLAEDGETGSVVGQFAFLPYLVKTPDKELKAYRPAAPVVSKKYRYFKANPLEHPAIRMYLEGAKLMKEAGADLIFMVPNPSWIRLMKMFPNFHTAKFPLFSKPLAAGASLELDPEISYRSLDPADPRIDLLWEQFSALHRSMVVRDTRILPWKIGKGDHEVLGIERAGKLIAMLALRAKGEQQWLIDDLMFADCEGSLRAALAVAERAGLAHAEQRALSKVAVLATPLMQPSLMELDFKKDAYDFPFVVQTLADDIKADTISPTSWFLSAND